MSKKNNNIKKLFNCYKKGFEPPSELVNTSLMKYCKVFYNKGDSLIDIMKLVKEREPVNIEMKRYYSENKLKDFFGYKRGYYGKCQYSKSSITPPNFIVYTPTKVLNYNKKIHILNAIGLAFDNKKQLDYKNYMKISKKVLGKDPKHILYCKNFYVKLFNLIFKTALKLKKKNIIMSLVGANNFAKLWYGGSTGFQTQIWFPIFNSIVKKYEGLKIMFMGTDISNYENLGYFPELLNHPKIKNKLEDTLFINAWDCWSIPGNGNNMDNSLDGYIGRNTQIAINGTSLTNTCLLEKKNYIKII